MRTLGIFSLLSLLAVLGAVLLPRGAPPPPPAAPATESVPVAPSAAPRSVAAPAPAAPRPRPAAATDPRTGARRPRAAEPTGTATSRARLRYAFTAPLAMQLGWPVTGARAERLAAWHHAKAEAENELLEQVENADDDPAPGRRWNEALERLRLALTDAFGADVANTIAAYVPLYRWQPPHRWVRIDALGEPMPESRSDRPGG